MGGSVVGTFVPYRPLTFSVSHKKQSKEEKVTEFFKLNSHVSSSSQTNFRGCRQFVLESWDHRTTF